MHSISVCVSLPFKATQRDTSGGLKSGSVSVLVRVLVPAPRLMSAHPVSLSVRLSACPFV